MVNPIKTPQEMLLQQAGVPALKGGGQPTKAQMTATLAMAAGGGHQKKKQGAGLAPENTLIGYRATDNGTLESVPTKFNKDRATAFVNAYMDARDQFGLPNMSPEQLTNRMLVEGRSDFGYNKYDTNNKTANQIYQYLQERGYGKEAGFPAAIYATDQRARAHDVPFNVAWNGEGVSKQTGLSGWDYNDRMNNSAFAATHPQNAALLNHISGLMADIPLTDEDPDPSATRFANTVSPNQQTANLQQPSFGAALYKDGGHVKNKSGK